MVVSRRKVEVRWAGGGVRDRGGRTARLLAASRAQHSRSTAQQHPLALSRAESSSRALEHWSTLPVSLRARAEDRLISHLQFASTRLKPGSLAPFFSLSFFRRFQLFSVLLRAAAFFPDFSRSVFKKHNIPASAFLLVAHQCCCRATVWIACAVRSTDILTRARATVHPTPTHAFKAVAIMAARPHAHRQLNAPHFPHCR